MSKAKEFARNAFLMTSSNLFNMFVALASMFFYTRILAPVELALIPVLEILSSMIYVISNLGLGLYVQRRMPAILTKERSSAVELARIYTLATFLLSSSCCLVLALVAPQVAAAFMKTPEAAWQVVLLIPAILVTCWWTLLNQLFLGTYRFATLSVFSVISQILHPLAIISFYYLMGIKGVILGLAVGKGVVCLVYSWTMREYLIGRFSSKNLKHYLKESWPFCLEGLIFYPVNFADRWLVGVMLTPVDLATYYVPRTMYERLNNLLKSFTNVMLASLSIAHSQGTERFRSVFRDFRKFCIYLFTAIAVALVGLSYYLIDLLAGAQYHAGILPFALLMGAILVQALVTPYYLGVVTALPAKKRLAIVALQSLSVFVLVPLLGWLYALNGIAGSRAVTLLIAGALSVYLMRALIPIELDIKAIRTVLLPSAVMLVVLIAGQLVWYNYFVVPFYAMVGFFAFAAIFLCHLSEEEFSVIAEVVPERLQWAVCRIRRYRDVMSRFI